MTTPPRTPAECVAALIAWLTQAIVTRGLTGQLAQPLVSLIVDRLRGIKQRVVRLAALVQAGRYRRRVVTAPRRPREKKPRRPSLTPHTLGWLVPLVPDATAARAQLENLFRDPEMAALMAAAPASLARPLRSLCRMLGATPPPVLVVPAPARPVRPRKPRPAKAAIPPKPPPPELPAWMRIGPPRKPWSLARIRGSPKRD